MRLVIVGLLTATVTIMLGCSTVQACRTAEEQEYFDSIGLLSSGMANHMEEFQQLILAYQRGPAWESQMMDKMIEIQRTAWTLGLQTGPPSTDEIQRLIVRQNLQIDQFLLYYTVAIHQGMDAQSVDVANRTLHQSDETGAEVIMLVTKFPPACQG